VVVERRLRFELLYAKYASTVKAYVLRRVEASTADDVVAEVFVVCWRRFEEVPPDPLPWLLAVARRVLSTQRRGERRRGALHDRLATTAPSASLAAFVEPPGGVTDMGDGVLAAALAQLSETDRELLLLIAWDGLTPAQAAIVLDVKPATARVRLLRARRRLTRLLAHAESAVSSCVPISMEGSS
jgi:RNA polymerase sigma-70 factor (ECF subfamily)